MALLPIPRTDDFRSIDWWRRLLQQAQITTDNHIADEDIHADHTAINIIAGYGLDGGGSIDADVTLLVNESELDHALLSNLEWSVAAHTIDTAITMNDNSMTGTDTITFTDVNGTIAGIANKNLLDKDAAETITGYPWTFQNSVDSTTAFQVLDVDGGIPILNVNTIDERVGIRTSTPSKELEIFGQVKIDSSGNSGGDYTSLVLKHASSGGLGGGFYIDGGAGEFVGISGWDNGSSGRNLYFGGGGWGVKDANEIIFWTDPTYAGSTNEGVRRMTIFPSGNIRIGGGTNDTQSAILTVGGHFRVNGSAAFNEDGTDEDFRVEGVGQANALFVQGSDGYVGIFNNTPSQPLTIAGTGLFTSTNQLQFGDSGTYIAQLTDGHLDFTADVSIDTNGSRVVSIVRKVNADSPYTQLVTDEVIICDTDAAIAVTLLAGVNGKRLRIVNSGSGGFAVTITPDGAETIDGSATLVLYDGETADMHYETTEKWMT